MNFNLINVTRAVGLVGSVLAGLAVALQGDVATGVGIIMAGFSTAGLKRE